MHKQLKPIFIIFFVVLIPLYSMGTTLPDCAGTETLDANVEDGFTVPDLKCAVLDTDIGTITGSVALAGTSQLIIYGDITTITGDLVLNNGCSVTIHGDVHINGALTIFNGASVIITGSVTVDGSVFFANNSNLALDGGELIATNEDIWLRNNVVLDLKNGSNITVADASNKFDNDTPATKMTSDDSGNTIVAPLFEGDTGPFTCSSGSCTDTPGLTKTVSIEESDGSTVVSESGLNDDVSFVLDEIPNGNVTISFSIGSDAILSTNSITFTTGNWNIPQLVSISSFDDAVEEGTEVETLVTSISSTDTDYNFYRFRV